jgi:TolB-like protein
MAGRQKPASSIFSIKAIQYVLPMFLATKYKKTTLNDPRSIKLITSLKIKKNVLILNFVIITLFCSLISAADEPTRIAVLPFKINAEKDLSFLRDGINEMLASRLTFPGKVQVISKSETENALQKVGAIVNEATARELGTELNADFVLYGSLTVFGNSLSLDAKLVDVTGANPSLTFFNQSQDMGEIIPRINQFAAEINEKAFGRPMVVKTTPMIQPAQPKTAPQPEIYSHPEKLLQDDIGTKKSQKEPAAPGAPLIMSREQAFITPTFWKSRNFKYLINGLAVGDVDGDGQNETVIITPNEVRVYRTEDGRFFQINRAAKRKQNYYIGVDVADINGNGYAEIFVSSFNKLKNGLASQVIEFDGNKLKTIVEKSPYYYRVAKLSDGERILLGQKNRAGNPYGGSIFKMVWQNQEYVPDKHIKIPRGINVLGFSEGIVLEDGRKASVAYKDDNHFNIIDPIGEVLLKHSERFGGSTLYYAGDLTDPSEVERKIYLPMRILVRNNGAIGESEIIAVKNYEAFDMNWERRHFNETHIESFSWDGLGLATNWKTRKFSGHIRDFAVADFDNDGKDEVVAAVILKEGAVVTTKPKTTIIAYEVK